MYTEETNNWIKTRIYVLIISIIFFLINLLIITKQQLKENKKMIALKMSMGLSNLEIAFSLFIETLLLSSLSNIFLFLTIGKIGEILNTFNRVEISYSIVFYISLISIFVCLIINYIVFFWITKMEIKNILVSEEG